MREAGANVNQLDINGNTALNYAYDVMALRLLLDAGTDPTIINDARETLLHGHDNLDIVRFVLEEGNIDLNLRTKADGYTPLLETLSQKWSGKASAVKALLLLVFGADASVVDNKDNSAHHFAAALGTLVKRADGLSGLFEQRAEQNTQQIKLETLHCIQ
jgi:ankyrin repeat protein